MALGWIALFPGQGSQHVGMGKQLYADFAVAREAFEEASDAAKLNLKKLCFDGPESDLTLTENTQPCLLTTSVAAFRAAEKEMGIRPIAAAGHSLGEYSALVAIGALPLSTAARWVRERGAAMQRAVPKGEGTMAAIMGLDDDRIDLLCKRATENARGLRANLEDEISVEAIVEPANFNSPGQTVIAGSRDAVAEAVALIKAGGDFAGGKAIPLSVSAPFHCKLMRPARDKMADLFSQATAIEKPKSPLCAYVPNRTARATREPGVVFELLVEQVDHPVLWRQSMAAMLGLDSQGFIEFGPGKVLQGLAKRCAQPLAKTPELMGVSDTETLKALTLKLKGV